MSPLCVSFQDGGRGTATERRATTFFCFRARAMNLNVADRLQQGLCLATVNKELL